METDRTEPTAVLLVFSTAPTDQAEALAEALVEERLAACVNVTAPVRSIYRWQGKVEKDDERLLIIKTDRAHWPRLRDTLARLHPYEVPEILALPVADGERSYLRWVEESL